MMPWIKVRTDLHEQREVIMIAKRLKIDRLYAAGACIRFWAWMDGLTADGYTAGMTP